MFSKSCKYAIRAVLYLAVNSDEGQKLGINIIAGDLNIPRPFLAKILQPLSKNEIISSKKGLGGGFFMTSKNRGKSVITVIEIIDGIHHFENCVLGLDQCSTENPCPFHEKYIEFKNQLTGQLKQKDIGTLALEVEQGKISLS